jgi:uncharacterized protein DUF6152
MKFNLILLITASLLLIAAPAIAHHSISGDYFMDQTASVEGEVVKFDFRNPHSWVELSGKDTKTGEMVTWSVEWNGAARLGKDGVTAASLKPGDRVVISGQPGRKPEEHRMHALTINRPSDGWKWDRAGSSPRY